MHLIHILPQILNSNWDDSVEIEGSVLMEVLMEVLESSLGILNITRLNNGTETPAGTTIKVRISGVKNIPYSGDVGDYNISTKQSMGRSLISPM